MVKEAEQYAAEDEKIKKRVEAKNGLENYAHSLKNATSDPKMSGAMEDADKKTINDACETALKWLDPTESASAEEFEAKRKELEGCCQSDHAEDVCQERRTGWYAHWRYAHWRYAPAHW